MITLKKSRVAGAVRIPASKSQTIRALLIAMMARGKSVIRNPLISADTESCMNALRKLGCSLELTQDGIITVDSTGLAGSGSCIIDTGNSGTTAYLIYGLLGTLGLDEITLTGDEQLRCRPIANLVRAYNDLGMDAVCETGCPPVRIRGRLKGGKTSIECPTSQYLSSLLLALPLAQEDSFITVPLLYEKPYVRMTLDWLDRQGIICSAAEDYQTVSVRGGQHYHPFDETIAGDYSSAAFFFAAAAVTAGKLTVTGLDPDDSQGDRRFLSVLEEMGCNVETGPDSVTVEGPQVLRGGTFDINDIPDCLPVLSILGAVTDSPLRLTNVANARIKETDRIAAMADNLSLLGLETIQEPDGLTVIPGRLKGGLCIPCLGDHRIIMAMAVLSLIIDGGLTIDDESAASVTFPTFFTLLDSIKEDK